MMKYHPCSSDLLARVRVLLGFVAGGQVMAAAAFQDFAYVSCHGFAFRMISHPVVGGLVERF